ncbi:MAG TPA: hypothetical protein VML75_27120 [Kofleriaceae bacterium]|nr:hypothetical protein [Kofleriaceae bacterium]
MKPPTIPMVGGLTSLEDLSGLRELPGVPLARASALRPTATARMSRATDSLIATLVTMRAEQDDRPTEATGEIDTNPVRSGHLARRVLSLPMAVLAGLGVGLGASQAIGAISIDYVGAELAQAALLMGTMLGAIIAAVACRLVAGRCGAAMMATAGVVGLAIGWATRLAIGGGLAERTLDQLSPADLVAAISAGAEHAAALGATQLLLVWACEAILILWFAAGLSAPAAPSVAARNA